MDKEGRIDFVWRYQPLKNTSDGVLLSYVKHNAFMPPREMILQSLRAYWLTLAYQEKGDIDPVFLERMFRKAVYALEKHALYLCDQAGIDYPLNFYRELPTPKTSSLSGKITTLKKDVDTDLNSSNSPNNQLYVDDLLQLSDGEKFDDSGFS